MTSGEFINTCEQNAMKSLITEYSKRGFNLSVLKAITEYINKTSYEEFSVKLAESMNINYKETINDIRLSNYLKDLAIDITSQYTALRNAELQNDLIFYWYRYIGSNLTNSIPFCLAMTEKEYFHKCEIPKILQGDFPEFKKHNGIIDEETDLPEGLYLNTTQENFHIYKGSYGCGHQIFSVPDNAVPNNLKEKICKMDEYKDWIKNKNIH